MSDSSTSLDASDASLRSLPPPNPWLSGPLTPKLVLFAGLAALIGVFTWSLHSLKGDDYKVLFANLGDRDGGAIIAALGQQNIPYRFAAGGEAILVPADQVHAARLRLATNGLPRGSNVGFELLDTQRFGTTQFQERLNYQRGLQGELTRTIESLAAVETARVHLALPTASGFLRAQEEPSASVMVRLHPGRLLDRSQTAGIVHLVAASIPQMQPRNVKVVDQEGNLISQHGDGIGAPDTAQLAFARSIETALAERIVELLTPIVGRENVRAQVTADIDFSQSQSTDELFKPNQGTEPAAVRSQQWRAEGNANDLAATGIPGALSNQPGPDPTAPVNGPAQPPRAAGGEADAQAARGSRESVVNYEVDKTIRVTQNPTGSIRRLTAAVVVNHRQTQDAEGKLVSTPLEPAELEAINALVREAIGFSAARGDSMNVMNSAFTASVESPEEPVPLWQDPKVIAIALEVGKHLGIALLGLLTILKVIRPALRAIVPPAPPPQKEDEKTPRVAAVVADELELPAPEPVRALEQQRAQAEAEAEAQAQAAEQEKVLRIARENPTAVAHIVRNWLAADV